MKARYRDVPKEAVLGCLTLGVGGESWSVLRGKAIDIESHVWAGEVAGDRCGGPWFVDLTTSARVPWTQCACIHIIELDESSLDSEVESIYSSLPKVEPVSSQRGNL